MLNSYKAGFVILIALAVVTTGYYELAVRDNIGNQLMQDNSNGTLNLFVYDSPLNNLSAVYITFSSISLYGVLGGSVNYSLGKTTINILETTSFNASLLKDLKLAPSNYTSIKLVISGVVINSGGINKTLKLTSNNAYFPHSFSILYNRTTNVNIEFDLATDINFNTMSFSPNGSSSYAAGTPGVQDNGTLNMFVYDAPKDNVSAVYLNFSMISLHGVQTGWTNYSLGNMTVNILNMTMKNASLLKGLSLGPQNYTMIRLYIQNVTVTANGSNESFSLASPFAFINMPFNVSTNGTTNMYIQFGLSGDLNMHSRVLSPKVGATVKS